MQKENAMDSNSTKVIGVGCPINANPRVNIQIWHRLFLMWRQRWDWFSDTKRMTEIHHDFEDCHHQKDNCYSGYNKDRHHQKDDGKINDKSRYHQKDES